MVLKIDKIPLVKIVISAASSVISGQNWNKILITYLSLCGFISIFQCVHIRGLWVCMCEYKTGERWGEKRDNNQKYPPCSSPCCKRLWTCQSLLSWPAGFLLPGSSWLPSLCGQSAGRPGRPCQQQSVGQCAASGTVWAPPGCCVDRLPLALHQDRETCTKKRGFNQRCHWIVKRAWCT